MMKKSDLTSTTIHLSLVAKEEFLWTIRKEAHIHDEVNL